jgi:hypothetical protein
MLRSLPLFKGGCIWQMDKNKLVQVEQVFRTFIMPLMDEDGMHDFDLIWEFEKYLTSKEDEIARAEKHIVRKWQVPLLNK